MLVVRAVNDGDVDGLLALAQQAGSGMTTLKPDRAALARRVSVACASFSQSIAPERRDYLFVLEDCAHARIAGVCAIKAQVGLEEPFYNYRIGTMVHASAELGLYSRMQTLYLSNDLTGCAELCSLFLHPDYRSGHNGMLLSKSRLLFIAQFPDLFPAKLIAELRGFLRADGSSPFWDHLGRHFFQMDFARADELSGSGQHGFIAALMPRHPLYVDYLPQAAREVIGRVHSATRPARRMLEQEGMYFDGYIDIFDAGPVLQARVAGLRALHENQLGQVVAAPPNPPACAHLLVASSGLADFRVLLARSAPLQVALSEAQRAVLACALGAPVRTLSLHRA